MPAILWTLLKNSRRHSMSMPRSTEMRAQARLSFVPQPILAIFLECIWGRDQAQGVSQPAMSKMNRASWIGAWFEERRVARSAPVPLVLTEEGETLFLKSVPSASKKSVQYRSIGGSRAQELFRPGERRAFFSVTSPGRLRKKCDARVVVASFRSTKAHPDVSAWKAAGFECFSSFFRLDNGGAFPDGLFVFGCRSRFLRRSLR